MPSRGGRAAPVKGIIEKILVQLPGAMGIGIRQGGFIRCLFHSQMPHFAQTAGQTAADFSQAFGLGDLAEQHGNELIP